MLRRRVPAGCYAAVMAMLAIAFTARPANADGINAYLQTNLVSSIPGVAAHTDPDLKNPLGHFVLANRPVLVVGQRHGSGHALRRCGRETGPRGDHSSSGR
jgi:hypothetical protein